MTIYFKNGETLHIAGEEGKRINREVMKFLRGTRDLENRPLFVVVNEEDRERADLVLNIDEVACIR